MEKNNKSQFQERLVNLFLRLNGYFQSGYIPHSEVWGNAGTEVDRIAIRFPNHTQTEREVLSYSGLDIPVNSIDIVIAEVKNDFLKFNDALVKTNNRAEMNWIQILNWIGLFQKEQIEELIPLLIDQTNKHGLKEKETYAKCELENNYGLITIRPILFSIETKKSRDEAKKWINGDEILIYMWNCFCPEIKRDYCSTRYPFNLWGSEYTDIVEYIKNRHKSNRDIGTLEEMYAELIK